MISAIIPIYNEEGNIQELHREVRSALQDIGEEHEIIFIDDGSDDNSAKVLRSIPGIKIVSFRRNFGQTAALAAGFSVAIGDIVVTMDGDRQNDPADIKEMLTKLRQEDLDVVCGWRKHRKDPFSKKFISHGANLLRKILVRDHIQDSGCTLRVYKKEATEVLKSISGEAHRFIAALLVIEGFMIGEQVVKHRPRVAGLTKYNWKRTVKGLIDMFGIWFWRSYSGRPLHLFGSLGIVLTGLGSALGIVLVVLRLLYDYSLNDKIWPLIFVLLIVSGLQLFVTGLLADISVKQYFQSSGKKHYNIKEIIET
jgi:glycosyltransferase involved in cell wall biosynthesis